MRPNSLHARDIASLVHRQTDFVRFDQDGALLIDRGETFGFGIPRAANRSKRWPGSGARR
jgi:hypothetical protein